jgi:hypothetical protein
MEVKFFMKQSLLFEEEFWEIETKKEIKRKKVK